MPDVVSSSLRDRLPAVLARPMWVLFGLWTLDVWLNQMTTPFLLFGANPGVQFAIVQMPSVPLLLVAALVFYRRPAGPLDGRLDVPACILMLLGNGALIGSGELPQLAAYLLLGCSGIGFTLLWLRWCALYASLSSKNAIACVLVSNALSSFVKGLLLSVPQEACLWLIALLPLACLASLRQAGRQIDAEPALRGADTASREGAVPGVPVSARIYCRRGSMGPVWHVAACLVVGNALLVMGNMCIVDESDMLSDLVQYGLSALVCLGILALFAQGGVRVDFTTLWTLVLTIAATALVFIAVQEHFSLPGALSLRLLFSLTHVVVNTLGILCFTEVARHSDIHAACLFSIARLCRLVPLGLISLGGHINFLDDRHFAVPLLLYAVVLAIWLAYWRRTDFQFMFMDLYTPAPTVSEGPTMASRCARIGGEFGLTDREIEVMTMMAQGRSRAYIAEALYLSENTVKGHARHVYAKLGIHNRTELQKMTDEEPRG